MNDKRIIERNSIYGRIRGTGYHRSENYLLHRARRLSTGMKRSQDDNGERSVTAGEST